MTNFPTPLASFSSKKERPTTQLPQELVEYIIDFLHDSPRDWPACALVARSWVYPTQSHIFQSVRLVWPLLINERLWAHFEALKNESPHLIRHTVAAVSTATGEDAAAEEAADVAPGFTSSAMLVVDIVCLEDVLGGAGVGIAWMICAGGKGRMVNGGARLIDLLDFILDLADLKGRRLQKTRI
ncbi:hypothetical protein C8R44DRAFT_882490 [Mycena epipterygia]|nr:hypothetical protein C8R44DRAFT_882490 [Mycena epipterygia]